VGKRVKWWVAHAVATKNSGVVGTVGGGQAVMATRRGRSGDRMLERMFATGTWPFFMRPQAALF
jgi:hypothetical protein